MNILLNWIPQTPIVAFTILLLVVLTLPPIFERLRLPGLVGLLVAGVVLGPEGLGFLDAETDTMTLLSDIGKIYLMFVAGLEIDLDDFRKQRNQSLIFGGATFLFPLVMGAVVGRGFGMGWNAAILTGSLLASHTLLGFPIVNRLGVIGNKAVTATIGATIITDIAALLVLAICISIHAGNFSALSLMGQLLSLGIYVLVVVVGFNWAGRQYFKRTGDDQGNKFLFILLAVFLASVGAQVINIDKIVGAFLVGLAVNDVLKHGPVEEKVIFVGSTLFIPFFFVDMGLVLKLSSLKTTLTQDLGLTVAIVGTLFLSKFLAAVSVKGLHRYSWNEVLTMWSLSLPQVAATLAAALAGKTAGLLTDVMFNVVILLMLVTAIVGPILTARFARKLPQPNVPPAATLDPSVVLQPGLPIVSDSAVQFKVMVPVSNPSTERYLIEMAALLARHESGMIVPLSIAKGQMHMDEPELEKTLSRSKNLLARATAVSQEFQAVAQPIVRIDDDVAHGIVRAAREQEANVIVMGWHPTNLIKDRLFGSLIDRVFWSAHCPIAVMRLQEEPVHLNRVLVPINNLTPQALRMVRFAQIFAESSQAEVTLLHVCDRKTETSAINTFQTQLSEILAQFEFKTPITIKIERNDAVAATIVNTAQTYNLVVMRSVRRRTAGGLQVSDVTSKVIPALSSSLILLGEPHYHPPFMNGVGTDKPELVR